MSSDRYGLWAKTVLVPHLEQQEAEYEAEQAGQNIENTQVMN